MEKIIINKKEKIEKILNIIYQLTIKISGCDGEIEEKNIMIENYESIFEEMSGKFKNNEYIYPLININSENKKYMNLKVRKNKRKLKK